MNRRMDDNSMRISSNDKDHDHHDANDPEDQFESQLWAYSVLFAAIPLLYYRYYKAAFSFLIIGLLYIFQSFFIKQKVPLLDQYKIKYDIFLPDDVIDDIYALHGRNLTSDKQIPTTDGSRDARTLLHEITRIGFNTLAKKYSQIQEEQKRQQQETSNVHADAAREIHQKYDDVLKHLGIQYQDLIHTIVFTAKSQKQQTSSAISAALDDTDDKDEMLSAALALLALISKQGSVRQRYLRIEVIESSTANNPSLHEMSFEHILHCIDAALLRAKKYNNTSHDGERKDRIAAEVQRKACLFIGAISDDNSINTDRQSKQSLSIQIGQQGGIQTILNALSWYQCHVEVVNWGLWSLFILCYENTANQMILIQLNGIPTIIQSMKNCFDVDENDIKPAVDVARHGTAMLFDLLREQDDTQNVDKTIDRWKVRNTALSSGLHECIAQAMTISILHSNSTNMDIFVMGREILVGTNYQGSIPEPPLTLIPSS